MPTNRPPPSWHRHPSQHPSGYRQQDHSASLCPPPPPLVGASQLPWTYGYNASVYNHGAACYYPNAYNHGEPRPEGTREHPASASLAGVGERDRKRQRVNQSSDTMWKCETCQMSLESEAALQAHTHAHITCTECKFTASRKVVKAHFQSVHGKFSGRGFKTVTIAVPGCPVQRFRICVGNHPDDIQKWIQDRKRRFPRQSRPAGADLKEMPEEGSSQLKSQEAQEIQSLGSLFDGYGSSSDEEPDSPQGEVKAKDAQPTSQTAAAKPRESDESLPAKGVKSPEDVARPTNYRTRPCRFLVRNGTCRNGDACNFSHDIAQSTRRDSQSRQHKSNAKDRKGRSSTTLLKKLLETDARREATLTLQLLHYLVECNYLQERRPDPSDAA